jgi:hypothetical protein
LEHLKIKNYFFLKIEELQELQEKPSSLEREHLNTDLDIKPNNYKNINKSLDMFGPRRVMSSVLSVHFSFSSSSSRVAILAYLSGT